MDNIYSQSAKAAKEYGEAGNILMGSNIAGFNKVAEAMMAQGIVQKNKKSTFYMDVDFLILLKGDYVR